MPADRRLATWLDRGWPSIGTLFDVRAIGAFETTAESFILDDLIVQFASGSARLYNRSRAKVRSDGMTMLGVNIIMSDGMTAAARGQATPVPAGAVLLVDAAQPLRISMPAGDSIQLIIPRELATAQLGPVAALHCVQIGAEAAALLVGHLRQLRDVIGKFSPEQGRRLVRTVLDMLAIALENNTIAESDEATAQRSTATDIRNAIEDNLGRQALTAGWLAGHLGMARSTLYRAFGPAGIEAYVRAARLDRIAATLADPASNERIVDLAYRWHFSDASHLARQFRARFGKSPTAYRRETLASLSSQK